MMEEYILMEKAEKGNGLWLRKVKISLPFLFIPHKVWYTYEKYKEGLLYEGGVYDNGLSWFGAYH